MLIIVACTSLVCVSVMSYVCVKVLHAVLEGEWTKKPEPFRPLHEMFEDFETKDNWLAPVEPLLLDDDDDEHDD
tara:strand:- start:514 stop:735 length:222 start_codon:yes stop_codon:yes gene_type:complete